MNKDEFNELDSRIRMLEIVGKHTVSRLNTLITIAITGIIMPVILKHFGW
jgi:hypothetical protein